MPDPAGSAPAASLTRRALLVGAGALAGLAAARGLGAPRWLSPDAPIASTDDLLRRLAASLTPGQRALIVHPADHPSRQIVNTISVIERPHLGTLLSPTQRALVQELYLSLLSPRGRDDFAGTVAVEGRLDGCVLAIYGEPERGDAQVVIEGGHLMLRGGAPDPNAALGGGIAYGHQIGNQRWRVEGNAFAHHGDAANRLFAALAPDERLRAIEPRPPHELVLQPQGAGAAIPGARVGDLGEAGQQAAQELVATVLSPWPDAERARAIDCLDANGGVGALHFACFASHGFYADMKPWAALEPAERARRGDPYWQVWRLEGPGSVFHFQGSPHVHAYVRILRDPTRANLGESLGVTPVGVEGDAMRTLLEGALRRATGETLAFHGDELPGRFCAGEITTGLAWSLDPYRNRVALITIDEAAMAAPLRERLAAAGGPIEPRRRHRIATTSYFAGRADLVGAPERVDEDPTLLRDALVEHLRAGGLSGPDGLGGPRRATG